ncbi:MAG: hypothetical protein EON84_18095 [Bradyrhizobiaceae bacterium]|jgi:hypothetical protein|nr:MAG: hypothetical protein EON84_18095 [Bradyrhizobiaceae bacterium]
MQRAGLSSRGRLVAIAVVTLLLGAVEAHAATKTCKFDGDRDAITAGIKAEFSCEGAFEILEPCALNTSGDNALSDIVLKKCEPRFLPAATPAIKAAYAKANAKCNQSAEKNEGSMYQGLAAVCRARAGRDFARKYGTRR